MDKKIAALYYSHIPLESIDDAWEQHFFEQKQYFLTHAPLGIVWKAKLNRLMKKHEAYLVLTEQQVEESKMINSIKTIEFDSNAIKAFHTFHSLRSKHKIAVLQSFTLEELKKSIYNWLAMEYQYASYWSVPESEKYEEKIIKSQEIDPMDFLTSLHKLEQEKSLQNINDIKHQYKYLPSSLKKEVKRLTLLANE